MSTKLEKYHKFIIPSLKIIVLILCTPIIDIIIKAIFTLGVLLGTKTRLMW